MWEKQIMLDGVNGDHWHMEKRKLYKAIRDIWN